MKARLRYGLRGGFTPRQLATIREQALRVLAEVGLAVPHQGILKHLAGHAGVRIRGERVCYAPELSEQYLELVHKENGDYTFVREGEADWLLRPSYLCLNCYDPLTGAIWRATSEDLRRAAKLCDCYGMNGTAPVHPQDVPPPLRQLNTLRICLENSRGVGRWMTVQSETEARLAVDMAEAAGRVLPHVMMQITISPLRLNTEYLDIIFRNRKAEEFLARVTIGGGAIPMLGATGPLSAPAAWVQATAEALGAYMTAKLVAPAVSGVCSSNMFPFDMRGGGMVIGSPEGLLARLMSFQINAALFGFHKGATLGAMGMPLDAQSAAEKMGNILLEALAGARVFYDIGMTPMDDVFCLEQVVFDREIVAWVRRFVEGLPYDDDPHRLMRTLEEGIAAGSYLMHEDTVAGHRSFYWQPELFRYDSIGRILAEPERPSLAARARAIVERDLARHDFELPEAARREVATLYRKAEQLLIGR